MPFQHISVSLDAGTAETYARVRRGGDFDAVKRNIERITRYKRERGSGPPTIDSFYVVMRSNFREIPTFLELLHELGIHRATFQIMLIDDQNQAREPRLGEETASLTSGRAQAGAGARDDGLAGPQ